MTTKKKRKKHAIYFEKPSLTRGSFKDEVDINNIVARYADGVMPRLRPGQPQYGEAPDQTLFEAACIQAEIRSSEELAAIAPEAQDDEKPVEDAETPAQPENGSEELSEPETAAEDESSG